MNGIRDPPFGSRPVATSNPGAELGSDVKLLALQPAVAPRGLPEIVALRHFTVTAEDGTVGHPLNALDAAPTRNVQVRLLLVLIENVTDAFELPATFDPGAFALNEIVAGDAVRLNAFCACADWMASRHHTTPSQGAAVARPITARLPPLSSR